MEKPIFNAEFLNFAEDISLTWNVIKSENLPVNLFSSEKNFQVVLSKPAPGWNGGFRVSAVTGRIEVSYEYLLSNEAFTGNFVFYQLVWCRAMFILNSEKEADEAATKLYFSLHKPAKEMVRGVIAAYGEFPERNKTRIENILKLATELKPIPQMKYTKKPVTIEAVLWDGKQISEVTPWIREALNKTWGEGAIMRTGDVIEIYTLEGIVKANPGDYILRGVKGELYPCKPDIFAATYSEAGEETALQKLSKFQEEVGYVKGPVNTVALLGLFGEAGEVLGECKYESDQKEIKESLPYAIITAIDVARNIDNLKKIVRDKIHPPVTIHIEANDKLNTELADVFYYIHALAKNRGLSLEDLAAMSLKKIGDKKLQKDVSHGSSQKKWIRFIDQAPHTDKKITARHITTPHIIGEPHFFDPTKQDVNLAEFEWSYVEA